MYAEKLSPLILNHPDEAESLLLMASFLNDFESRRGEALFRIKLDPRRMFDIMQAGTTAHLAILIKILIEARIFQRHLIVRCPSGEGLQFRSYGDIPEVVRDPGLDVDFEVEADVVEPSYSLVNDDAC
ncbi:hypothetical protein [Pseudomonas sp. Irchel 3E13]|uniref:hypothetical protein n=1 Tax=Pseudomonas sp. Irchel 3E13 TaxID=2008975 RepID=UPI002114CC22|nr:hypothetical protein [Pseudomonas sp. Irchel 3E13]